ncbi:MAG: hypothetical protein AMJ81_02270 [Phycisphaerae bacterium SM23_33]|nr:MAG: hypothetical protein AMJ81_02270 [Phycisphaerae bacterium SM23_33]
MVSGCIGAMGGLERWQSVGPIRAQAVVIVYDEVGTADVSKQDQVIDLRAGTIRASARLPETEWTAKVTEAGGVSFKSKGPAVPAAVRARHVAALKMILHRVRGPLNLCGRGERARGAQPVRVDGMDLIRVPAQDGRGGIAAYYFDAQSCLLRLVTAGADAPGGEGTVTRYSYRTMANGLAFPERISVFRIGRHVLVGDEPVLEVNYHEVSF